MTLEAFALATRARIDRERGEVGDSAAALSRMARIATRISDALQFSRDPDLKRLVPGAGLCRDGIFLFPTVLADRLQIGAEGEGNGLLPFARFPVLRRALAPLLGTTLNAIADELRVVPVSQGFLCSAPGTDIRCGGLDGCMGPHVDWGTGEGFLTAGHVAQTAGAKVTDTHGSLLGKVKWSNDPATAGSTTADLDVAVVEFDPSCSATTGRSSISVGAGDDLTIISSGLQSEIFGFFSHVTMGIAQASYADCYATDTFIAQRGDSGGLVEAFGDVAGMVIGGFSQRDMTIVQSIDYQLREISKRSSYAVSL